MATAHFRNSKYEICRNVKFVDRASLRKKVSMDTPRTGMIDNDFVPFLIFSENSSEVGGFSIAATHVGRRI